MTRKPRRVSLSSSVEKQEGIDEHRAATASGAPLKEGCVL